MQQQQVGGHSWSLQVKLVHTTASSMESGTHRHERVNC